MKMQKKGNHLEAIADFTKAIELDPTFSAAFYNRGLSKLFLEKHKEAILDFNRAIEFDSTSADAYYMRGYSKLILRMDDDACLDFRKADSMGYEILNNKKLMVWIKRNCY